MFRRKLVGAFAATLMATGLLSPVAHAQSERVVAPEDRDAYVSEFYYEADNPPVVDGVGGLTDEEAAEVQDKIRQAEASGPPQDEIIPGQMWSDKVGVPDGYDKAEADRSEVAIAKEQSQPQARTLMATAERCKSFWLIPFKVCGEILDRYEALGGETSWLLLPIEHQSVNPDGQGHRQRFVGGVIYQHPDTGAHAVSPMTMDLWQRHGWEAGWLGYPLGGEVPVQGSNIVDGETSGWVQRFQGGRIYRTPFLEGFQLASINGLILDKWLELGGPDSDLGFPVADEAKAADGIGRFSVFQNGAIYWHPDTGAHSLRGELYDIWLHEGGEEGSFGYPIGEPIPGEGTVATQQFQEGELTADISIDRPEVQIKEFLPFDTLEEAREYFENLADGQSVDLSPRSGETHERMPAVPTSAPAKLECDIGGQYLHRRTKDTVGIPGPKVGFKPFVDCKDVPGDISRVDFFSRVFYEYWGDWVLAHDGYLRDRFLTFEERNFAQQLNVEVPCMGDTWTWFKGDTYASVDYMGVRYWNTYEPPNRYLPCQIARP